MNDRPPLKLEVSLDEGTRNIHMSYGLWNDLQRMCPDASMVLESGLSDPWARDYILRRCLTDSKKTITDEKDLIAAEDMNLSDPGEMEKILTWVQGHLLHFFASSAEGMKKLGEKFKAQLGETPSAPSSDGSAA